MYRVISKRLWERPLDMNLYSTIDGELRIPFSYFVLPAVATDSSSRGFPRFWQLPAELQLRVISFCDNQTLFQLMHTSSYMRYEAKKLFFSNTNTWYCVDAAWIIRGCYPGDTIYDMEFLPMVKQVEVQFRGGLHIGDWLLNYHRMGDMREGSHHESDDKKAVEREFFDDFWHRLHASFPQVVRVMVQCNDLRRPPGDLPTEVFKRLARRCRFNIEISFSLIKTSGLRSSQAERSIWHQSSGTTTSNVTTEWEERTNDLELRVMLPVKQFRGPLGMYEYMIYKRIQYNMLTHTFAVMLIVAVERQHFYGQLSPFRCPAPSCSVSFNLPGEFTTHMISYSQHREHIVPPECCRSIFAKANARLKALKIEKNKALKAFEYLWGQIDTKRRTTTEAAAVQQIASDPLYASKESEYGVYIIHKALHELDIMNVTDSDQSD